MSWEKVNTFKKSCKCGKGTIVVIVESDDWNRIKHSEEISCSDCKRERERENDQKRQRDENVAKHCKHVLCYFKENYINQYLQLFYPYKYKKQVWRKAITIGVEDCTLGTFYSKAKNEDIDSYIMSYINITNLRRILDYMNISDNYLERIATKALKLYERKKEEDLAEYINSPEFDSCRIIK